MTKPTITIQDYTSDTMPHVCPVHEQCPICFAPPLTRIDPVVAIEGDRRTGGDNRGYYIRTFTGKQFHWNSIETNEIDVRDIAHALSMNCRWTGHVKHFISVAQHSVLASLLVPAAHKLGALFHDASEAYVHDTPSPLKWHLKDNGFTVFAELEKRVDQRIFSALGLEWPRHQCIKDVDLRLLATEHRDLMPYDGNVHGAKERRYMVDPYPWHVRSWEPAVAEQMFLNRYQELINGLPNWP